ncbi:O-antigen ligase family protein, partial [Romboutsia ilealis]|uniref:O-antigen ligase family protein n=1 Tax=Romboutsia ilealis TaxID=1115758 RepID=UPI00272B819F
IWFTGHITLPTHLLTNTISICMYMEYLFWVDRRIAFRNFCLPTLSMALLTSITMFIFHPEGMYLVGDERYMESSNFFWGFDNASVFLFIPTMFFLIMYSIFVTKKHVKTAILLLFMTGSFLYVKSITAFAFCLFITLGYIVLVILRIRIKYFNMRTAVTVILALMISLLYLKDNFNILMKIAENTGKFYSIKARFIFWERELEYIIKSPLIGYGIEDKLVLLNKIFIDHPHNYFFDILYRGGFIAAASLGIYFYLIVKPHPKVTLINTVIVICFISLMICSIFDFYNDIYLFYPHLLATYFCYITSDDIVLKPKIHEK